MESAIVEERAEDRLSKKNLYMFSLATVGRDACYSLFNGYLLSFILFTKNLTTAQFASISIIIIVARLFDAFNDPFMGGIVENTRSKWGKFKPWQFIGAILTGGVIIAVFNVSLDGWDFIAFLAVAYFMFSITFTMNDISYWGMLPSLTSNSEDRNKLSSISSICAAIGGGAAGMFIPIFTTGQFAINGSAITGYRIIAIVFAVIMVGFQMFSVFGVTEKPLATNLESKPRLTIKQIFAKLFKNDQLMWAALIILLFSIGTNVVGGGLSMSYIYFEFGYDGALLTIYGIGFAVTSTLFTLFYPMLARRFSKEKLFFSTVIAMCAGYAMLLIVGLAIPTSLKTLKFGAMMVCNAIIGYGQGFWMMMVIYIANTVEYNELKTGTREEGLIFSVRPLITKLASAIMQGLVMLVYIFCGVLTYTNAISDLENNASLGLITTEEKLSGIEQVIQSVSEGNKIGILISMCLFPIVFVAISGYIYKKKCFINDQKYKEILEELAKRSND
ncbi:MAG: glycoside-pentoside-hexuronide (GPH):cation symporter [Bacillota bacterium]